METHDYALIWYTNKDTSQSISSKWKRLQTLRHGAIQLYLDLDIGLNAKKYMQDAGLIDFEVVEYKIPWGTWIADDERKLETRRMGEYLASEYIRSYIVGALYRALRGAWGCQNKKLEELKRESWDCLGPRRRGCIMFFIIRMGGRDSQAKGSG